MDDPQRRIDELEMKVAFLERHLEKVDQAFIEVHEQLQHLLESVELLAEQQKKNASPGGDESPEDAVPPHYSNG